MRTKLIFILCMSFGIVCSQNTTITDPNFEQRLIDLGYDNLPIDGMVPTININTITTLFIPNSNISDLTGIEDFEALETLDTSGNPLTNLDLSANSALISLFAGQNQLETLNISNNTALEVLIINGTTLGSLDVSSNTNLRQLVCVNNQLLSLDLSANTQLTSLVLSNNLFTTLDLSQNTLLESLVCRDTFNNDTLLSLILSNGNNAILQNVDVRQNTNLNCIEVDDAAEANANNGVYANWLTETGLVYSENCLACPEINVLGNGMSILNGDSTPNEDDHTDYGLVDFGSYRELTYTIENIGGVDLVLTGIPLITISNSADFEVVASPNATIPANGGTTTFTIRYTPSMVNTINTATVSFMSDDCINAVYSFDIIGQSQEPLTIPEVSLNRSVRLSPNPNNGQFKISYSGSKPLREVTIFDLSGKQLHQISLDQFDHSAVFDLKLVSGFYLLKIQVQDAFVLKRVIVNHY